MICGQDKLLEVADLGKGHVQIQVFREGSTVGTQQGLSAYHTSGTFQIFLLSIKFFSSGFVFCVVFIPHCNFIAWDRVWTS